MKVKCIKANESYFTKGNIYELTDVFYSDDGFSYRTFNEYDGDTQLEKLNNFMQGANRFEEVVEPKQFTKGDLKSGMIIEMGLAHCVPEKYLVVEHEGKLIGMCIHRDKWASVLGDKILKVWNPTGLMGTFGDLGQHCKDKNLIYEYVEEPKVCPCCGK